MWTVMQYLLPKALWTVESYSDNNIDAQEATAKSSCFHSSLMTDNGLYVLRNKIYSVQFMHSTKARHN